MKRRIAKLDPQVIRLSFPIVDALDGWFFRMNEQSAGVYLVEGTDIWGRVVSCTTINPEEGLADCVKAAVQVDREVRA